MGGPLRSPDISPRMRVLLAVATGSRRFREIVEATGLSANTVSRYLSLLVALGLLEKRGQEYAVTRAGMREVRRFAETVKSLAGVLGSG